MSENGDQRNRSTSLPLCSSIPYASMYPQQSGREPSTSVRSYSSASWREVRARPANLDPCGSPASAATPRPRYVGVSEIANPGTLTKASRQVSSVTPKLSIAQTAGYLRDEVGALVRVRQSTRRLASTTSTSLSVVVDPRIDPPGQTSPG